jgi:hypothetical protein
MTKSKRINKLLVLILAVSLTLMPLLVSCTDEYKGGNNSSEPSSSSSPSQTEDSSTESSEADVIEDSVPKSLKFEGETVTILVRDKEIFRMEYGTEEIDDSSLNALLIERTKKVEERLGIKVKTVVQQTDPGTYWPVNFNQKVMNSILSGDPGYDIISFYAYYGVLLGSDDYLLNLYDLPHLDFSKPWWNQDYINEITINNKLYFITGDACLTSTHYTFATFFNKNLVERWYSGINLYEVVDNGKWTIDYLMMLVKDTYDDLDGDGLKSDGDFYGAYIPTASEPLDAFFMGGNLKITTKNFNGLPELSFYNDKSIKFFEKMYDLLFETGGIMAGHYTGESIELAQQKFIDGETVFLVSNLSTSEKLRDVKFTYGILPIPKLEESQDDYYTCAADLYSILSVPACVPTERYELIGATMEIMAAESYKIVTPGYFYKTVKYGYMDDEDDLRMYDIILGGTVYNFGVVHSISIDDVQHLVRTVLDGRSKNFTSAYEAKADAVKEKLDKLLEIYKNK